MSALSKLDLPKFVEDNPALIRSQIIADYEQATQSHLYPAQADNFVLNELALREALSKSQFNYAMRQNFVLTASDVFLDALAAFWGVQRLADEPDERLRTRVLLAPEVLTTAGTRGAYEFHIRSVDPAIAAVGFTQPDPGNGTVRTYILTDEGLPSEALLSAVYAKLTNDAVRVLCVRYEVAAPEPVTYTVQAQLIVKRGYDLQQVKHQALEALKDFTKRLQLSLGNDVIPSQFVEVLHGVAGVHSVTMLAPAADLLLDEGQWPVNGTLDITVRDQSDG